MSFAHFNEIMEICNGMLVKDRTIVRPKKKIIKRYIIKSRVFRQEQLIEETEEENEEECSWKNGLHGKRARNESPFIRHIMGVYFLRRRAGISF